MDGSVDLSQEEMEFLAAGAVDGAGLQLHETEASLESEILTPSNTEELRGMLKQAGTDLTIKYLTGKISFEEYSKELEKSKAKDEKASGSRYSQLAPVAPDEPSSLPNFDLMMGQDYSGDEEESDEVGDDDGDDAYMNDFLDSGEVIDGKDEEWTPDGRRKKPEKEKAKKKESKAEVKEKVPRLRKEKTRRPRKQRRKAFDLPKIMAGTNGRAMLLRAQGKTEEAVQLFYEVIKHAPKAAAPYEALGSIQEEKGNLRQAIKFYMLAANLRGKAATEWVDIVDMCWKLNEDKLVMTCFVKGLHAATTNEAKLRILSKKNAYYLELGSHLRSLQTREQMLPFMDRDNPSITLACARDLVHDYLDIKEYNGAISTLQFMMKDYPRDISSEDIYNLVELQMGQKGYVKALETIVKHCGVTVAFSSGAPESDDVMAHLESFANKEITLTELDFPVEMPIDLKSKLLQCFVRMKVLPNLHILQDLIDSIVAMDADDYGDVHYDVAETMVVTDYHEAAKPILEGLVRSEKYNEAAVWLTLGQCLNALGDLRASIRAYEHVVDMAPGHHEARVTLSSLLQQMGQNEVALQVLSKGSEEGIGKQDQELLIHKCQLLHSQGKLDEFIASAQRLVALNLPRQFTTELVRSMMSMKTVKSRKQALPRQLLRPETRSTENQFESIVGKSMTQVEKIKFLNSFMEIFMKLCCTLRDKGMNIEMLETAMRGITCPVLQFDTLATKNVEFLCLKAGPVNDNIYHLARNVILEEGNSLQAWNLYNYIITRMKGGSIDMRFTTRSLMKNPDSTPLSILNGNERLISGTYTQALAEYMAVFKKMPDNDLVLLCSALCLLNIGSNNHVCRKNALIMQISCLMNAYKEMRGSCQESYYNIGRAWAQLNIQFAAVYYFKKALELPPVLDNGKGTFDLSREISYNLSRIYLRSNNPEYARYYIEKYCVI